MKMRPLLLTALLAVLPLAGAQAQDDQDQYSYTKYQQRALTRSSDARAMDSRGRRAYNMQTQPAYLAGQEAKYDPAHPKQGVVPRKIYKSEADPDADLIQHYGFEGGATVSRYRYHRLPDDVNSDLFIRGYKYGLTGILTGSLYGRWFGSVEGQMAYGEVDSDSAASGTLKNRPEFRGEGRILAGRDIVIFHSLALSPYAGVGYRYLYSDSRGVTSGGDTSFRRQNHLFYFPMGLRSKIRLTDWLRVGVGGEFDYVFRGWQLSEYHNAAIEYGDLTNQQHHGYGLRGDLTFETDDWSFGPYFTYWNIDMSNTGTSTGGNFNNSIVSFTGTEAHNTTVEYGAQARFKFN